MGSMYDDTPTSRFEEDMRAIIDGTPWPERPPKSKMEELLEELNDLIKAGGGGGSGTSTIAWKPTVAADGTISWTRTASETKPDDQNIKGPKGEDGKDGEDGLGIKQVSINLENHLIITYDDDTTEDAGALPEWSSTLSDLTDTAITSPTNGQVLTYNSTTGKWENADGRTVKVFVKATPTMTSATTPSGVASASSEYNGNYAAWYAFCGIPGNDQQTWATSYGHTTGEWIQYKFDEGVVIKKIATTNRNEGNPRVIRTFIFQGSNDGETYVDLANCEVESNQGHYRQEFLINNDTAYTYYRLYVTEPWVLNDTTVGLAQLEIYKEIEINITELGDLTDVNIYNASEGQALIYDEASSQWINTKVLSTSYGGTGNATGYVQAGRKANTNIGGNATAEGIHTTASGNQSHAEGVDTVASNTGAHAEGGNTQATGISSHAEGGGGVIASGNSSHAEGVSTQASGNYSHAEGQSTKAQAIATHSQNFGTTASANYSSAAGYYTTAGYQNQFVVGKYNDNKSTSIFEVGIGTGTNAKVNGLELDTSGNLTVAGTITNGNGVTVGDAEVLLPATVGWTGKNLLHIPSSVVTDTQNGLTFTVNRNSDGEVTSVDVSGTASANTYFLLAPNLNVPAGLLINGCPANGSPSTYSIRIASMDGATLVAEDDGNGGTTIANSDARVLIAVMNGTNMGTAGSPKTFYPMLRSASITDPTYEPYHKSVEECLEEINDKLSYLEQTVTLSTSASTTVTFTDSSITANSFIEYACSQWDLVPESITGAAGSCTIVLPKVDSAQSVTVRIYVR